MKDSLEIFYSHLISNFYNFPPRNQTIDNNKSLFNEVAIHYDIINFLTYFSENDRETTSDYRKTISDQNFIGLEFSQSKKKANYRKFISKSSPFPLDYKQLKREKEHWDDSLPLQEGTYEKFLTKIGIKKVAFDESHLDSRLSVKFMQEEIHKLNQKMNQTYPDCIDFERLSIFLSNNTIFTFVKGPKNTMKVIVRNITGKYVWIMKLFEAVGADCIKKKYDENGLEFQVYKNLILQQEGGNFRGRSGTQTHDLFEFKSVFRKPEKNKLNKMINSIKSADLIERENDFSQTLFDISKKIEVFSRVISLFFEILFYIYLFLMRSLIKITR